MLHQWNANKEKIKYPLACDLEQLVNPKIWFEMSKIRKNEWSIYIREVCVFFRFQLKVSTSMCFVLRLRRSLSSWVLASSSLRWRNLKTEMFHSENAASIFRTHYPGETWKRSNRWSYWIRVWDKRDQEKRMIMWRDRFGKAPFSQCLASTRNVFKFLWFEERFRKPPFSWRISMHGGPNCRNNSAFSIFFFRVVYSGRCLNSFEVKQEWSYETERDYCVPSSVLNSYAWFNLHTFLFFEFLTAFSYCIHFCNTGRKWPFFCPNKVLLEPRHVIGG